MPAPDESAAGRASGDTARETSHRAQGPPRPDGHRRNPLTSTPTGGRLLSASQLWWFLRGRRVDRSITITAAQRQATPSLHYVVRVGHTAYLRHRWSESAMAPNLGPTRRVVRIPAAPSKGRPDPAPPG